MPTVRRGWAALATTADRACPLAFTPLRFGGFRPGSGARDARGGAGCCIRALNASGAGFLELRYASQLNRPGPNAHKTAPIGSPEICTPATGNALDGCPPNLKGCGGARFAGCETEYDHYHAIGTSRFMRQTRPREACSAAEGTSKWLKSFRNSNTRRRGARRSKVLPAPYVCDPAAPLMRGAKVVIWRMPTRDELPPGLEPFRLAVAGTYDPQPFDVPRGIVRVRSGVREVIAFSCPPNNAVVAIGELGGRRRKPRRTASAALRRHRARMRARALEEGAA